jgi:hypothetical protein
MPSALSLSLRRLLGALAYANDSAELSFARLSEAARRYRIPSDDLSYDEAGWVPANRLSIITDAWACVDHVNRARKLVRRFQYGDPKPSEVALFLNATKPAALIRNRIQHLDEDIFKGTYCVEGKPVLGAVSWADARCSEGHIRYSISSGPSIDGGQVNIAQITDVDGVGNVLDFRLEAADHAVHLDETMKALTDFMSAFEISVRQAVISSLRAAAVLQGVSLHDPRPHGITDMTVATRMSRNPEGGWTFGNGDCLASVEVPPGSFDISEEPG